MKEMLLSVVIANYNYGRFLESAIMSILRQNRSDVELIVIDGGSTDNSLEVIRKYEDYLSYWVSEKDRGQSHAFNKGFSQSKGRFLTWLNADDIMASDAIAKLSAAVEKYPRCEWFIGGCCWLDPNLKVQLCTRARPLSEIRALGGDIQAYGPSSFFSRNLFARVGGYVDERFHYMMDIELWNRFYQVGHARYQILPGYIWGFRMHPDAKTSGQRFKGTAMADPRSPIWEKKRKEKELNASLYCKRQMTLLRRLVSISWRKAIAGRIDTLLYKGCEFGGITSAKRLPVRV